MNIKSNGKFSIVPSLVAVGLLLVGCGQKVAGNYNLIQSSTSAYGTGSYGTNSIACQQISLNITENGSAVSASGSNTCFTETLTGTESGGVIQATLIQIPTTTTGTQTSYTGYQQSCIYTGTLTINSNVISGTLNPQQSQGVSYGCTAMTITGTKTN